MKRALFFVWLAACSGNGRLGGGDDDAGQPGDPDGGELDGDAGPGEPDAALACAPTAGPAIWIEEGQTASATVACATGADPGPAGFEVGELPIGATYDGQSRELSFSPTLDQAAVYRIALTAPDAGVGGETGELVIGVADRFDDPDNVPIADPARYPEEMGLPVFFISPAPTDSETYAPVTVVYRGVTYSIVGKLRGASSLSYPKKSMTLDFSGGELTDADHGMLGEKKIVLTTTFDDNAYLRGRLTWALWNRLGPTVPVAHYSAIVYLDGEFHGLYTVSDHIDDELFASAGLPETGNLYKAVNHDANFKLTANNGSTKTNLLQGYEKKHGLPDGDFADLDALVRFVATASDATFGAELAERIEVADFEAWWLLATFLKLNDSAGKNSYLHHSPTTRWTVVPWDFNDSLGQNWYTLRQAASPVDGYTGYNRLFGRLTSHADFGPPLAARYAAELGEAGAFDLAAIEAMIDELAAELSPSVARDERRWRSAYLSFSRWSSRGDFLTAAEETAYVREWIADRWAVLRAQYP